MKSTKPVQLCSQESFKWYMAACMALAEFRRKVQEKCGSVLADHMDALAAALGVKPAALRPLDYPSARETTSVEADEPWLGLGVNVKYRGTDVFCAHVWWSTQRRKSEEGEWEKHPHGVQVWVSSKQKSDTDAVYGALDRITRSRWFLGQEDEGTIYRWNEIPLARMPQFEKDSDVLVADAIKVIRRSGAFRKRKPKTK